MVKDNAINNTPVRGRVPNDIYAPHLRPRGAIGGGVCRCGELGLDISHSVSSLCVTGT